MKKHTKPTANEKQVGGTHYKTMGVQPWDVVDTWPIEQRVGAYRAGALKYVMRMGSKDEASKEVGKGIHYLEKLKELLESDEFSRPVGEVDAGSPGGLQQVARSTGRGGKNVHTRKQPAKRRR